MTDTPAPRPLEELEAIAVEAAVRRIDQAGFCLGSAHAHWDRLSEYLVTKAGGDPKRFGIAPMAAREGRLEFVALPEAPPASPADPSPPPGSGGALAALGPGTVMEDPHEIRSIPESVEPPTVTGSSGGKPPDVAP